MCGRYRRTTSEDELARRYHIPIPPQRDLRISWNIAPTSGRACDPIQPRIETTHLDTSVVGPNSKLAKDPKIAYKTVNARVETIHTAPSYREAFKKRRCLFRVICSTNGKRLWAAKFRTR